jgi:hypothetical protein
MTPAGLSTQYYDKTSKQCLVALAPWFYLYLKTGISATIGKELSQELIEVFGKRRRLCDVLFELLGVIIRGRSVAGLMHLDAQTRALGDEVRRAAGYKGMILDSDRFSDVLYFVQAFIFLTALPEDFRDFIDGFPDDTRLFAIDMTKVDGRELLALGLPEAAVFACLSTVVERNLLIRGIVKILNALNTLEERALWIEACLAFGRLRKDHKIFNMMLKQELERTATTYSRQEELRFIFGDFIETEKEEWYEIGKSEGESEGFRKGESEGQRKERLAVAQRMLQQNVDRGFIAAVTGLTPDEISALTA